MTTELVFLLAGQILALEALTPLSAVVEAVKVEMWVVCRPTLSYLSVSRMTLFRESALEMAVIVEVVPATVETARVLSKAEETEISALPVKTEVTPRSLLTKKVV